jgi:hypothetical protein
MSNISYDLSSLKDASFIEKNKLINKSWSKNNKIYNINKYDKNFISPDNIDSLKKFRSVITSNNMINVFSPPKALNIIPFMNKYTENECFVEEYIEGTMINLFYDSDLNKWEISTKTSVGGNIKYFKEQPTFAKLFNNICKELNIDIEVFSKDYCYSFIMQHPQNKLVLPIVERKLYLIACYKIQDYNVTLIPRNEVNLPNNILLPKLYDMVSYNDLHNIYGSMNTRSDILGVMIYHINGERTKIHNPNYQYIKYLRGNNTKQQFQYLALRRAGLVKHNLKYFPENGKQFLVFKNQVHIFTDTLYTNYISCYIKKYKKLIEFPKQFRIHMYYLHQYYLSIRENRGYINKNVVIQYINSLEPARLMYSLNYHLRDFSKSIKSDISENNSNNIENNSNNIETDMDIDTEIESIN